MKKYKWDIAISLCNQDVDFARKLVKAINPSLEVFFYENRQEELINKSGPDAFARTFKEESRIVIILSRNEWSNSFYTDIERNAIIDRTAVKNEGYQFLMVIPMAKGEIPPWYPSTRIYVSPFKFSIEQLARFIEFKVTEEGGIVKTLTVEDRYQNLIDRIESKKAIINLQREESAIQSAKDEVTIFKNCFNSKIKFLCKTIIDKVSYTEFMLALNISHLRYGDYILECQFAFEYDFHYSTKTTQDIVVEFVLSKIFDNSITREILEEEQRIFYYSPELKGWAIPHLDKQVTNREIQVLFRTKDNSQFYDLTDIMQTDLLIDYWFQRLLSKATETIERYI